MSAPDARPAHVRLGIERRCDAEDVIVLALCGEIDLTSAADLEFAVVDALATAPGGIVMDLRGVEFVDSTGLRALIVAQDVAASNGHSLVLRHVRPQARRLFELSGTADAFATD